MKMHDIEVLCDTRITYWAQARKLMAELMEKITPFIDCEFDHEKNPNPSHIFLCDFSDCAMHICRPKNGVAICRAIGGKWKKKVQDATWYEYERVIYLPCGQKFTVHVAEAELREKDAVVSFPVEVA